MHQLNHNNITSANYKSFPIPLLRNLQKNEHKHMLNKIVENFDADLIDGKKSISTKNDPSYEKVQDYYDGLLNNDPENILEKIENELVYSLAFDTIDEVIIYKINDNIRKIDSIMKDSYFNKKIYQQRIKKPDEASVKKLELITIRRLKTKNTNCILFLFSHGIYKTLKRSDKKLILFSCIIDLNKNTLQIKYQSNNVKNLKNQYNVTLSDVFKEIREIIQYKVADIDIYDKREIRNYEKNIYLIFKDFSDDSEKVIKKIDTNKDETNLVTDIEDFMTNKLDINLLGLGYDARNDELINSYSRRILSIYYQNVAMKINDNKTFQSYLYAFTFLSSESTRSSTSKGNNEAIYKDDIFWRLKDLIHTTGRIKSLSVFDRFNKKNPEKVYTLEELNQLSAASQSKAKDYSDHVKKLMEETLNIDYKVEAMHGGIKLHYNKNLNTNFERGIKNDYVIAKIVKYL